MSHRLLIGHVIPMLATLETESVNCIVTSPPYWQQRDYKTEHQVWDGKPRCKHVWGDLLPGEHVWGDLLPGDRRGGSGTGGNKRQIPHGDGRTADTYEGARIESPVNYGRSTPRGCFCQKCGAWKGELGQEPTIDLFIRHTVQVFDELYRVLRKDGICFLDIGDTRQSQWPCRRRNVVGEGSLPNGKREDRAPRGTKEKAMALVPERLLIALDDAGWIVRSKIVWEKPSAMPETAGDRPTGSWEPIYMLVKSARYWSDFKAIREECSPNTHARLAQNVADQIGSARANGGTRPDRPMKAVGKCVEAGQGIRSNESFALPLDWKPDDSPRLELEEAKPALKMDDSPDRRKQGFNQRWDAKEDAGDVNTATRNVRNVWRFSNPGTKFAHYAAFPPELPKRCILCGCPPGGTVLDPFVGTGTTMAVAVELGRNAIGIDLDPGNAEFVEKRLSAVTGCLFAEKTCQDV